MQRAAKALPSALWARAGAQQQGLWQTPAMAMATKVDGSTKSGLDEGSPGANTAERKAFKSDMDASYGDAYSTRSSDEGFGERYGEAVKVVLEKKEDTTELQRGATAERDQNEETVKQVEYDTSQGEHVQEKEVSRHSTKGAAFGGGHGGAAT